MAENIRDFLLRFPAQELVDRGVLQGNNNSLRGPSIDPLIALMKEHGVDKLDFPNQEWFLDLDGNFNNPRSRQNSNNVSQLSGREGVFTRLRVPNKTNSGV